MDWNFSVVWLFLGILVIAAGGAMVLFYQPICNNMLDGVSSYEKCKKWGLIVMGIGVLIAMNLHTLLLSLFVKVVFQK
ncbi:MAG: hypothetical protein Q4E47_03785 [Candidatus Saccharibacteria bacterium]|nr:hypothetical protein [Candidatus Saccharibacteria bacterium]